MYDYSLLRYWIELLLNWDKSKCLHGCEEWQGLWCPLLGQFHFIYSWLSLSRLRLSQPLNSKSLGGSVGCASDWRPGGRGFDPCWGRQHSFVEIDHEIFSTVILSRPLVQEGQLSVSGERMCTILVNRLEDLACPVNVWLGKLTALDMTPLGWLGRKTSTQTN